jgi:hypothetical protein
MMATNSQLKSKTESKSKLCLRQSVRRPVYLGVKPHLGPKTRFLLLSDSCGFVDVSVLSDERTGLSFTIAAGPHQRSHSRVRVRGTHDHILLSRIRDSPKLDDQVLRNRVAQLYPGSEPLFVVSYDSQGYGGCIRIRLHTGFKVKAKDTLRPAIYGQSVRLGIKPLETHDQRFISTEHLR